MTEHPFSIGDSVKIVGGPFDGHGGEVISAHEAAKAQHRWDDPNAGQDGIWIGVNLFGRIVPVRQSPARLRSA